MLLLASRFDICIPASDMYTWWMQYKFQTLLHKQVVGAATVALIYYVWKARNDCLHNNVLARPESVIRRSLYDLGIRCNAMLCGNVRDKYDSWMRVLMYG
ncbi:hypothetical protein RND81_09G246100 [Saponaria officinalis]|uniref:Uncharacterized protein n=1 Tax=Saponaria officinalis TaxID=3572 RepID=A0AAW1IR95_SAPOF